VDPTLIQEAPFLFVYQPALLMNGSWGEIVVAFGSALIGITALSAAVARQRRPAAAAAVNAATPTDVTGPGPSV